MPLMAERTLELLPLSEISTGLVRRLPSGNTRLSALPIYFLILELKEALMVAGKKILTPGFSLMVKHYLHQRQAKFHLNFGPTNLIMMSNGSIALKTIII